MSFVFSRGLKLDDELREELSSPFGEILKTSQISRRIGKNKTIYAIGDVTVASLLKLGYMPKISIFDYRTERRVSLMPIIRMTYKNPMRVKNCRGVLGVPLWKAVEKAFRMKTAVGIRVYGEEDLASLACIYFAKNGSIVMYGMRKKGIAVIIVDRKIKRYIVRVLIRMAAVSK